MKRRFFSLGCTLALISLLGACKKAEQPQEPGAKTDTTQPGRSAGASTSATASNESAAPLVLKPKWPVGSRFIYRMDLEQNSTNQIPQLPQPMQQTVVMAMTYAMNVLKETAEGGREVEMEFLANEMEMKMGEQVFMSFDSKEKSDDAGAKNPLMAPFRKMIGSKVRLQLNADGKLDKVINLDEWVESLAGGDGGPGKMMLQQQFNEDYFRQVADFGSGLPSKPVKPGESWPHKMEVGAGPMGKIAVDSMVTFERLEKREAYDCAVLETVGSFQGGGKAAGPMGNVTIEHGKIRGTSWFDTNLGALVESSTDQSMQIKGEMPGATDGNTPAPKFTSDITQTVLMKLVERTGEQ